MSKRLAVKCLSCKLYNFPDFYIETDMCENKKSHSERAFPCICYKGKVKDKNDVDSLRGMRSTNECEDLDGKISNLRTELSSLSKEESILGAPNIDIILNETKSIRHSVIMHAHKGYEESVSYSGGQVDVNVTQHVTQKPNTSFIEKDFTKWLDKTIDSLSGKPCSNDCKDSHIPAEKVEEENSNFDESDDEDDCIIESDYSTHEIENLQIVHELLYESFVVQNYPCYEPPEDDDVILLPMNLAKRKRERTQECRNESAKKTRTSERRRISVIKKEGNYKKKVVTQCSSDSDVEVINIDDDSNNSYSEIKKVNYTEDKDKVIVIDDSETVPEKRVIRNESPGMKRGVWECPICFEQNVGQEVVTTMCGHIFCKKCLEEYFITHGENCPTCRTDLHGKPLITLFNF